MEQNKSFNFVCRASIVWRVYGREPAVYGVPDLGRDHLPRGPGLWDGLLQAKNIYHIDWLIIYEFKCVFPLFPR